ncbi:MAG: bile acid:sodium symporter family protein [Cyanobium sp.]
MQSSLLTTVLLPIALAVVMLGMGLGLVPEDFRRILSDPRAVTAGTLCQVVALPLIALLIVRVVPMPAVIAVGLIVLALCPGGPSSNLITYLARGDVALSVTLTAVSSLITVFTIPVLANLALRHYLGAEAAINLPVGSTMLRIALITLVPTALGMVLRQRLPRTAAALERQVSRLALALLALIILALLIREATNVPGFVLRAGVAVVLLNGLGILAGCLTSRVLGLPAGQRSCLAIEVGMQNGTLALAITAGLLANPEMAVPAALYSLVMYISGIGLIVVGRRQTAFLGSEPA